MKILIMSRYDSLGASSRVRTYQYLPYFRQSGISVAVSPLFSNAYLEALYNKKRSPSEVIRGYIRRFLGIFTVYKYDLVLIEKELFPFMPAVFERLLSLFKIPYLVDYDDALFHRYDLHKSPIIKRFLGRKIDSVMRNAAVVIAGNSYLAKRAVDAGAKKVRIIPSVVDTQHYYSLNIPQKSDEIKIGWIGTPKTSHYLAHLVPVFERLAKQLKVRFVAIGANNDDFEGSLIECWPWTSETEVDSIQKLDIGVMPLADSPWERGKCGYKLIQYMACGLPVVASPIGVNSEIIEDDVNGYLASSDIGWEEALKKLCEDKNIRARMGHAAREKVVKFYSLDAQKHNVVSAIREAAAS